MADVDSLLEKRMIARVGRFTSCWRKFLYALNVFAIILSATLLGLAIWYSVSEELRLAMPLWSFYLCISFGSIMLAVSIVGVIGTYTAPSFIVRQRCNYWMFIYQLAVLVAFVATIVSAVAFLAFLKTIEGARAGTPKGVEFEDSIRQWMNSNPSKWSTIESLFSCCGFQAQGQSPRDVCKTDPPPTLPVCKSVLYSAIETKLIAIGVLAVIFAFALLCAMMGSCCVVWRKPAPRRSLASSRDDL